jgi:acyl-coenzyme A synthetase/AMP-(fatty) acid ligase
MQPSPAIMLFSGYCNNAKATDDAHIIDAKGQRWFRTGDKGQTDAKGELWVTGRYKEIFKVATEEVAPLEVESTLTKHPGVKDAVIVATKDRCDERYHEVKAYVVRNKEHKATAQGLVDFVAKNLTVHKSPTGGVTFLDQIPRNAMKKVIARELTNCEPLSGSADYLQRPLA